MTAQSISLVLPKVTSVSSINGERLQEHTSAVPLSIKPCDSLENRPVLMSAGISSSARVYMDANATTPLLPEVFEAMRPYWMEHFGNASSIHQQGQHARGAVEQARTAVARFLHCLNSEIVFTSGGTESDNLAL